MRRRPTSIEPIAGLRVLAKNTPWGVVVNNQESFMAIGRSYAIEYLAPAFPGDTLAARATERAKSGGAT